MAIQYSGLNTFVPSPEASGNLIINYARNPSRFKVNRYLGLRKVDKMTGLYTVITPDDAVRIVNTQDKLWNDGNDRPVGQINTGEHSYSSFTCKRYSDNFALGYLSVEQASWQILAQHAAQAASRAMTLRTILAQSALSGASWGSNTATATSLGGGFWSAGTSTAPYILKTLQTAMQTIVKATNASVQMTDMMLVVNPVVASAMAQSAEMHDYVKSSVYSVKFIEMQGMADTWGLVPTIYGVPVIVEDAVQVTSRKGATRADSFAMDSNTAYLLSRPEGLNAGEGTGPTFNTLTCWEYESFTVESMNDTNNRRHIGSVTQNIGFNVTAPAAGYKITNILS